MRERIRIWTENVETFVLEVITEQRRDRKAAVVRFCLFLLSKVFAVAVKIRRRARQSCAGPRGVVG